MKVSIITVCYNSEKTIEKTIKSILSQSYKNYEYIIIDGSSTDKTLEIIKNYEKYFTRNFMYISEKDQGIYDAMNKGIKKASGDIIAILNSDDYYLPDTLKEVVKEFENSKEKIVSGKVELVDKNEKIVKILKNNYSYLKNIKKRMVINHPATFVKKEVYEKEGIFDINYKIAGDYEFLSRVIVAGYKIKFLDKVLVKMLNEGISNNTKFYDKLYFENKNIRKKYFGNLNAVIWGIRDKISYIKKTLGGN